MRSSLLKNLSAAFFVIKKAFARVSFPSSKICMLILDENIFLYHKIRGRSESFFVPKDGVLKDSNLSLYDWIKKHCYNPLIIVGIDDAKIITRQMSFPFTNVKSIYNSIPFKIEQSVNADSDKTCFCFQVTKQTKTSSEVTVKIAKKKDLIEILDYLSEIKIEPDFACPESIGMYEIIDEISQDTENCCILLFKNQTITSIVSIEKKIVSCRTIQNSNENSLILLQHIEKEYIKNNIFSACLVTFGQQLDIDINNRKPFGWQILEVNDYKSVLETTCENIIKTHEKTTLPTWDLINNLEIEKQRIHVFKKATTSLFVVFFSVLISISSLFLKTHFNFLEKEKFTEEQLKKTLNILNSELYEDHLLSDRSSTNELLEYFYSSNIFSNPTCFIDILQTINTTFRDENKKNIIKIKTIKYSLLEKGAFVLAEFNIKEKDKELLKTQFSNMAKALNLFEIKLDIQDISGTFSFYINTNKKI